MFVALGGVLKYKKKWIISTFFIIISTLFILQFKFLLGPSIKEDAITIVTAYIRLPPFPKTYLNNTRKKEDYHLWMKSFANIRNPVVAYFTNLTDAQHFKEIRLKFNLRTAIYIIEDIDRSLKSFKRRKEVEDLFNRPDYPKYLPNTWDASYSCLMNAKYEFLSTTAQTNPFKSRYLAWLDIGLFRELANGRKPICLQTPKNFDQLSISYGQVFMANNEVNDNEIFYKNLVWIAGGFFIGRLEVILEFCKIYEKTVDELLNAKYANTDQQVLYSIRNRMLKENIRLPIKEHYWDGRNYNPWFFLAYQCRDRGVHLYCNA